MRCMTGAGEKKAQRSTEDVARIVAGPA